MSISIHGNHQVDPNEFSFGNEIQNNQTANPFAEDTVGIVLPEISMTITTPSGVIVIPPGRITIGQFAAALGQSILNSHDAIRNGDLTDLFTNAKLAQNKLADAFAFLLNQLLQLNNIGTAANAAVNQSNADIQAMKDAIAALNAGADITSTDASAVNSLNNAIADYNNGDIDAATYNAAVATYNNYANARNATISGALATYNAAVDTFNTAAAADNNNTSQLNTTIESVNQALAASETTSSINPLPQLPTITQTAPNGSSVLFQLASTSPPATVPIGTLSTPTPVTDSLVLLPPPAGDFATIQEQAATIAANVTADFNSRVNLFNSAYDLLEQAADYYHFTLKGKNLFSSPALFNAQQALNFAVGGSSGGIIGGTITQTTGNPKLAGEIATSANISQQRYFQFQAALPNLFVVDGYTSFLSHDLAVLSGGTVISALGGRGITNPYAEKAFGTIFGQTYAQSLSNVTEGNQINDFVARFIKEQGIQDQDGKIAANLSDQVKTSLLQTALLSAETSGNLPGLTQQVNGLVLPEPQAPVTRSVPQVLNDSASLLFAQNQLGNVPLESVSKLPILRSEDYRNAVQQAVVNQGISLDEANRIADAATDLLKGEQTAKSIQNADVFDQQKVTLFLIQNTVQVDVASQIALGLQSKYITNDFQYVKTAQDLLTQNNITDPNLARNLYTTLNVPPPQLTADQLAQHLYTHTYNETVNAVGPQQAAVLAHLSAQTFVTGPQSVLKQLQQINHDQNVENTQLQELFRDFQSPNLDLFSFINQLRDPGRTMLHTAATGLMYNGMPEPSNFKKSVDILV